MSDKPLCGRKIVITRAAGQARELARLLERQGAEVLSLPAIELVPPKSWEPVDRAIRAVDRYDWILFTSANGVSMFFDRFKGKGRRIRDLVGIRIGAIGPKTSARLTSLGLKVHVWPDEYRAEALARAVGDVKGCRVLLARAERARDVLPKTLIARGALVTVVNVYRTIQQPRPTPAIRRQLLKGQVDAVTFTSSSTVEGFMRLLTTPQKRRFFTHAKAAVIGPITGATLARHGIHPAIRAKRYTIESLTEALARYFSK